MEKIRKAAMAFYDNSSHEIRNEFINFFRSMDTDGDGQISITEFLKYAENNIGRAIPVMLSELDNDRNGFLDFNEAKVYYYLVNFRRSFCDACGNQFREMYFTCCECFLTTHCYDICLPCYGSKSYRHEHNNFIDNHGMLMHTRDQLMIQQHHHTNIGKRQVYPSAETVAPANQTYGRGSPMATTFAPANQTYMGYGGGSPMATTDSPANQTYTGYYGRGNPMATTVAPTNQTYMGPGRTNPTGHMGRGRASQFAVTVAGGIVTAVAANQIISRLNPPPHPEIAPMMPWTSPSTNHYADHAATSSSAPDFFSDHYAHHAATSSSAPDFFSCDSSSF